MTYRRDFAPPGTATELSITDAVDQLLAVGVRRGDVLMIHASMRRVGPMQRGVDGLLDALAAAVGPQGTLIAYADFEPTAEVPYFDLERSPCAADHGVFAEALRQRAGTLRSANPGASVIANGVAAMEIVAPHPLRYGYGRGTPFERFTAGRGKVLLLGSDFDHVTILHHAEALADLPDKRIVREEVPVRSGDEIRSVEIEEFDTSMPVVAGMPETIFDDIVSAYIACRDVGYGMVGGARTYLLDAADLVAFAVACMERDHGRASGARGSPGGSANRRVDPETSQERAPAAHQVRRGLIRGETGSAVAEDHGAQRRADGGTQRGAEEHPRVILPAAEDAVVVLVGQASKRPARARADEKSHDSARNTVSAPAIRPQRFRREVKRPGIDRHASVERER